MRNKKRKQFFTEYFSVSFFFKRNNKFLSTAFKCVAFLQGDRKILYFFQAAPNADLMIKSLTN